MMGIASRGQNWTVAWVLVVHLDGGCHGEWLLGFCSRGEV